MLLEVRSPTIKCENRPAVGRTLSQPVKRVPVNILTPRKKAVFLGEDTVPDNLRAHIFERTNDRESFSDGVNIFPRKRVIDTEMTDFPPCETARPVGARQVEIIRRQ